MAINKWGKSPLKFLCHKIGDGLHGTPQYDESSDVLFINGNNLKNGRIITSKDTKRVTCSDYENNYIELNENSLLISINGTIGSMAFYNDEKVMLGKSAAYLNFKTGINKFYYYYFQLKDVQKYFFNVATGSTIKNLGLKAIQEFNVPSPCEGEWKTISRFLSSLDKKIELNNKINAELESMAKLIYDYWFVQFDFPDANGKPYKSSGGEMIYNKELKREIPAGWSVDIINNIVEVKDGTHDSPKPASEGYHLITSKNLKVEGLDFKNANLISEEDYENINKRSKVETGDILFSMIGSIGVIYKVDEDNINFAIKNVALYKTSKNKEYRNYIYTTLKSYDMQRYMGNVTLGSIQKFIGLGALRNMPLLLDDVTIKKFEKTTEHIFKKRTLIKRENQQLTELRDWLLPMLMNGQVTVKN